MENQTFPANFVVSANYKDRNSDHPWLIRKIDEKPDDAVAHKTIHATNISFGASNEIEFGFGCTIVANCETATGSNEIVPFDQSDCVKLRFCKDYFIDAATGNKIDTLSELYLLPDGSMHGKVLVAEAQPAD